MAETAVSKIPEVGFKIPTGHVERATKNIFLGDGTKSAREHIEMIEEICGLFRIPGISEDYVKRKLLFMYLSGNARIWFMSLDERATTEWSVLRKIFFLNILLLEKLMRAAAIFLISGHIWERVLLKLGDRKSVV